jgi:hypothetical protein
MVVLFVVIDVNVRVINYFTSRYQKFVSGFKRWNDFDGQFTLFSLDLAEIEIASYSKLL